MGKLCATTEIPASKTRQQLEMLVRMHGATTVAQIADDLGNAKIAFEINGIPYQFSISSPDRERFNRDSRGYLLKDAAVEKRVTQEVNRLWRVLYRLIEIKLDAVEDESGMVDVEAEFLPYMMLRDGRSAMEVIKPQVDSIGAGFLPMLPGAK